MESPAKLSRAGAAQGCSVRHAPRLDPGLHRGAAAPGALQDCLGASGRGHLGLRTWRFNGRVVRVGLLVNVRLQLCLPCF